MKAFAELYRRIDETTKTNSKLAAMVEYFSKVSPECGAWAIYFLAGNRLSRVLPPSVFRQWASQQAGIPTWLFEESYGIVGDLAETVSLLIESPRAETQGSLSDWVDRIAQLAQLSVEERIEGLSRLWQELGSNERFAFAKLITGSLRVGVSRRLVTRAIAEAFNLAPEVVAHRLMGRFAPTADAFMNLISPTEQDEDLTRPFPFCLAHPILGDETQIGPANQFLSEWKWDGIRAQVIRRQGASFIWSRGEERIEDRFPEITAALESLPQEIVLDGELLAWRDDRPLGFLELQRRLNRKQVGKKLISEVPIRFIAFDLLEQDGVDLRGEPLQARRNRLERLISASRTADWPIQISPAMVLERWEEIGKMRDQARELGSEGLMLKSLAAAYAPGRVTGVWWKWKIEPLTIDAVLIYAQRGRGRRATLYTDYTFALWDQGVLVPFAKAYSGLSDAEMRDVDRFVRTNTKEKFGPVRSVRPHLVMELAFENVQLSRRHKSGVAVRFPRIVRWRMDKQPQDANTLDELKHMIRLTTQGEPA